MELSSTVSVDDVKEVVVLTLGLEDRGDSLVPSTPLFGSLPELDSMAVAELLLELEQRFEITIEGDEVTGEVFETLESLTVFVDAKLR